MLDPDLFPHFPTEACKIPLQHPISIINNLRSPPHGAPYPHARIQMQIPMIARLHVNIQPVTVRLRVHLFGTRTHRRQFRKHLSRADSPPFGPDCDVSSRLVVRLQEIVGFAVGAQVLRNELLVLAAGQDAAFAPAAVPVSADERDPVALAPDALSDADFRVQLHAHLKVALESGFGDGEAAAPKGAVALEARGRDHDEVIGVGGGARALVRFLVAAGGQFGDAGRAGSGRAAVGGVRGGELEEGVLGVVFFHGIEVGLAVEEVGALARGVFRADRLAVDALRGETLQWGLGQWAHRKQRRLASSGEAHLVSLLCAKLDECGVDITESLSMNVAANRDGEVVWHCLRQHEHTRGTGTITKGCIGECFQRITYLSPRRPIATFWYGVICNDGMLWLGDSFSTEAKVLAAAEGLCFVFCVLCVDEGKRQAGN
jgi:hypothetical protein